MVNLTETSWLVSASTCNVINSWYLGIFGEVCSSLAFSDSRLLTVILSVLCNCSFWWCQLRKWCYWQICLDTVPPSTCLVYHLSLPFTSILLSFISALAAQWPTCPPPMPWTGRRPTTTQALQAETTAHSVNKAFNRQLAIPPFRQHQHVCRFRIRMDRATRKLLGT